MWPNLYMLVVPVIIQATSTTLRYRIDIKLCVYLCMHVHIYVCIVCTHVCMHHGIDDGDMHACDVFCILG